MAHFVKRAYKYRFYPTPEQAEELVRTFGCVRLVYNKALEERTRAYKLEGRGVSYAESSAALTAWKKTPELAFLCEVSSVPLQQALRHLQAGFANFFARRAKYPTFKSRKRSRASAEYTRSAFRWRDEEKIAPLPPVERSTGVDAGLTALLTLSCGEQIANPRHERRERRRLVKAQRALARKQKGSSNRAKARLKVARVHARIAERRRDYLHKVTTRLVSENQVIAVEDLAVRNMVKNHALARAISDAGWRELRRMLEYKTDWYGRTLAVADRFFPSSKLCSVCGTLQNEMPLSVRVWVCACGAVHDREVNAARNMLLAAGLAES